MIAGRSHRPNQPKHAPRIQSVELNETTPSRDGCRPVISLCRTLTNALEGCAIRHA
jgi:hypothetical protein